MEKGQASLEYLIGFAIVLIMALVVLSLLGIIPDFGLNVDNRQAESFWAEHARPFAVVDAVYTPGIRRAYLAVENMENERFNITSLYINGSQVGFFEYNLSYADGVGPSALVTPGCTPPACNYSFQMNARQTRKIATDPFMSADEICGAGGLEGKVPFQINYSRVDYTGRFTQIGPIGLALKCIRT